MTTRSHPARCAASVLVVPLLVIMATTAQAAEAPAGTSPRAPQAELCPLTSVRLLGGPFAEAVEANRSYMLALDPDRLLAPFLREAGLEPRAKGYGNWESIGLDGHTAGHYLSALSNMIASGNDTPDGELECRLDHMLAELDRCQKANGDGYLGGVPGGSGLWADVGAGRIQATAFDLNGKWVPWYNLHKTFAGLRDAARIAHSAKAREILIHYGDWCVGLISGLSDQQMQSMLQAEPGGMNEVLADLYAITGQDKYLRAARRFCQEEASGPLEPGGDRLTGRHANTEIPKVIGLARIAAVAGDADALAAARRFWEDVTGRRTVAFGGNSVFEHFNDPKDFGAMIEARQGPETCNTYNMLRLTEQLFAAEPRAAYADYYERALYNHILASIHPTVPGYVYFTPIRPEHYRVYSQPDKGFWCCVGTGMENPGKYGELIYARAKDDLYVNLFVPSELTMPDLGLVLRQETSFPDEPRTGLVLRLREPTTFTLHLRHPGWVAGGTLAVRVNGEPTDVDSTPSSYASLRRRWHDGDRVAVELPMRTTVERLPDGSDWVALLHGPIVLASPDGTNDLIGLRADDTRMGHVAHGPTVPLDQVPVLITTASALPRHVRPDPSAGPLGFRLVEVAEPPTKEGLPLLPFFRLHDVRYQMYWQLTTRQGLADRRARVAAAERAKAAREAATLDRVAIGQQQPEVEHDFAGEATETGWRDGHRWRRGPWFEYRLDTRGASAAEVLVVHLGHHWSSDSEGRFDVLANGRLLDAEPRDVPEPAQLIERRYGIPPDVLADAADGQVAIRLVAKDGRMTLDIVELRLMRPEEGSAGES
jgi:DUF1680 family protein